jgi:hypothetical protein
MNFGFRVCGKRFQNNSRWVVINMYGRDRHRAPQITSSSKGVEAGFYLYEPSLDTAGTSPSSSTSSSSSSIASSLTSPTASSTAQAPSKPKKRRWYRPRLRIKLHADWIWVGFIRAGNTTPTGRGGITSQGVKDDGDDWEQLPAYVRVEEGRREQTERIGGTRGDGLDEWLIEPPAHPRRDEGDVDPPAYRQRDR